VTIFAGGDNVTCPTNLGTPYLHAFLLGTEPGNPSATPVQGRSSALSESFSVQQRGTACGVTVSYTAKRNAWYGLLMVDPAFRSPFVDMAVTG
jgi:hypothetical protein